MATKQNQLFPPPTRSQAVDDQGYLAIPFRQWLFSVQNLLPLRLGDTSAGPYAEALPPAGLDSTTGQSNQNQEIIYLKVSADASAWTITGAASGGVALTAQFDAVRFKSDGTNWWKSCCSSGGGAGAVSSVFGRAGAVVAQAGDYAVAQVTGAAPLASPALTGNPTVPTQAPGTNNTRAASTAYADAAVAVEAGTRAADDATLAAAIVAEAAARAAADATLQPTAAKDAPNGYAGLDAGSKVAAAEIPNLPASIITSGQLALARGGTNADLSASGSATAVLAQDAGHVVSARSLVAGDIPNLDAAKITTGALALARGGTNADLSGSGSATAFLAQAADHSVSARAIALADLPIPTFEHLFSAQVAVPVRNNATGTFGCEFYPSIHDVVISQLGRRYITGNTHDHQVTVWRVSDQAKMGQGTVLAASASDGYGYKWVAVTPFTLVAGTLYRIVSDEVNTQDTWLDSGASNYSSAPPLFGWAITSSAWQSSAGVYPSTTAFGAQSTYVGCGMKQ